MAILNNCFGMNLRTGSITTGVFVIVVCLLRIALSIRDVIVITANGYAAHPFTYASLVLDFLMVAFCIMLLVGIRRDYAGRALIAPFIAVLPIYAIIEAAINIWVFSVVGSQNGLNVFMIVRMVFWLVRLVLYVYGWCCVVSRYQEMTEESGDALPGSGERSAIINPAESQKPDYQRMQP